MRRVLRRNQRLWVISALLVALVVRALIPAGFMPATDRPLSFQICPDGFPAALLADTHEGTLAAPAGDGLAADGGVLAQAAHHHDGSGSPTHASHPNDGAALAQAAHHHDGSGSPADSSHSDDAGAALAHTGHHHADSSALASHSQHDAGSLFAVHHHGGPGHNHSSVNSEHCVFAAAAGTFALAFAATFSAPAISLGAPEVPYVSPTVESHRFHIPQPRGPPARS